MSKIGYKPAGIIRTLPASYAENKFAGYRALVRSIRHLETGAEDAVLIALPQLPIYEVLYIYLLIGGRVRFRLNIAEYTAGFKAECFDQTIRQPKYWAVCTLPVSRPSQPVRMRGFQGFRYTAELW